MTFSRSDSLAKFAPAYVKLQAELGPIKRTSVNPFYNSHYADLGAIISETKEPLATNGFAISQIMVGDNELMTMLIHESGEFIAGSFSIKPIDNKPQSQGSAITYGRRYGRAAILDLATEEDDDGNEASAVSRPSTHVPSAVTPESGFHGKYQKKCETCGEQFFAAHGEDWKKVCSNCYYKSKGTVEKPISKPAKKSQKNTNDEISNDDLGF